jgi:hypothetical protein
LHALQVDIIDERQGELEAPLYVPTSPYARRIDDLTSSPLLRAPADHAVDVCEGQECVDPTGFNIVVVTPAGNMESIRVLPNDKVRAIKRELHRRKVVEATGSTIVLLDEEGQVRIEYA